MLRHSYGLLCDWKWDGAVVGIHRIILASTRDVAVACYTQPHKILLIHVPCMQHLCQRHRLNK